MRAIRLAETIRWCYVSSPASGLRPFSLLTSAHGRCFKRSAVASLGAVPMQDRGASSGVHLTLDGLSHDLAERKDEQGACQDDQVESLKGKTVFVEVAFEAVVVNIRNSGYCLQHLAVEVSTWGGVMSG